MKIQTGMELMNDIKPVDGNTVRFIAEDGREMFQVTIGPDGRSIEVRASNICKVGGVMYDTQLSIEPNCANSILVRTKEYK